MVSPFASSTSRSTVVRLTKYVKDIKEWILSLSGWKWSGSDAGEAIDPVWMFIFPELCREIKVMHYWEHQSAYKYTPRI